jgi:uncharacterized protein YfaS (alpha-2-macroglobulin family)
MKKQLTLSLIAGFVLLGFATIFFFASPNRFFQMPTPDDMLDLRPGSDYAADWAKVDSLQNQGLTKSALELVNNIYAKAKAEQNDPQLVKAVIHIMKYTGFVEEEALVKNITRLQDELKDARYPLRPMLHSMLGEHYYQYYLNNAWLFANRTETVNLVENDPRTWDLRKLITEASQHYQASLADIDSLQRTRISYYDAVLDKGYNSEKFRPTLFDFLAHCALEFYANDALNLPSPAYAFVVESPAVFEDASAFASATFTSRDSSSNRLQSLLIYQALTRFHLRDATPDARVTLEMERLAYAKGVSVLSDKDARYLAALERLQKAHVADEIGTMVTYQLANYWAGQAPSFQPLAGTAHKEDYQKAATLCKSAIQAFPKSMGAGNCRHLLQTMEEKSLHTEMEGIVIPNRAAPFLVRYRNIDRAYFRVVPVTASMIRRGEDMTTEKLMAEFLRGKVVSAWDMALTDEHDYNAYTTDAVLPALAPGKYVLLASHYSTFSLKDTTIDYTVFDVSDIAYAQRRITDEGVYEFVLTNRATGKPLVGAKAKTILQNYDYNSGRYKFSDGKTYTSDASGMFRTEPIKGRSEQFLMEFTANGHTLSTNDGYYQYQGSTREGSYAPFSIFYTDRAIYRPGQTIYFKGILFDRVGAESKLRINAPTQVTFYDVNYQKVASLDLQSNEFGSVSGSFTAPQGQLNGNMTIRDVHGSVSFSVEDYKRPKFEVVMDPVKGSFRLGDKVKMTGKATAYAGSSIDGAEVKYRVVRTASFPYCYWSWWRPRPVSPQMEILQGTTVTDPSGAFTIEFDAIPDRNTPAETKPQFNYQVYVDVVDITGETHSTTGAANLGYIALDASINVGEYLQANQTEHLVLNSRNLNGQFEAAKGKLTVHRLVMPEKFAMPRRLGMPERPMMGLDDYKKTFPEVGLPGVDARESWAKGDEVLNVAFDTEKEDSITLDKLKTWGTGTYVAEMTTKDAFGAEVVVKRYFQVYEGESKSSPTFAQLTFIPEKLLVEPGEKAVFVLATAADKVQVLYEIEHKGKIVERKWMEVTKGTHTLRVPVNEEHRGGLSIHLYSVYQGGETRYTERIAVPWTNKQLKLEMATFRDKLWPGQKEEWLLKISGPKGEQVAAELLAGMYDASLDAFRYNYWGLNLNPTYSPQYDWSSGECFVVRTASTYMADLYRNYYGLEEQDFDALNWFDYSLSGYFYNYYRRSIAISESASDDFAMDSMPMERESKEEAPMMAPVVSAAVSSKKADGDAPGGLKDRQEGGEVQQALGGGGKPGGEVQVRTNLQETAFFFPQLRTNAAGEVVLAFTIPEALTRWRFMALAHTADLKTGYLEKSTVTQKDLMVMPNPPRFFRENDNIAFSTKISNLATTDLAGTATLELFDALTMQPINAQLGLTNNAVPFQTKRGQSTAVFWNLKIPAGIQAVTYRVKAMSGSFSDGEEAALPVLSNSMLVTESMPLPVRPNQTKKFSMDKLVNNKSTTLRHQKLTLEFTSNPAWYAVQALPYLMEYPYECTEQTFSRFYANSLASHIANSHPRIKQVFDSWAGSKDALVSNLDKNQELKALLLEETPWVLQSQDEGERKRRVALLFDLNRMSNELERALIKLQQSQVSSGGWTWFPGMPESRYITTHIASGMGHLDRLGVRRVREDSRTWDMVRKAVLFLDREIRKDYDNLKKYKVDLTKNNLGYDQIQYLYARSYFKDIPVQDNNAEAVAYYFGQAKQYWLKNDRYAQGMIALVMQRGGEPTTAKAIIRSLKENALQSDEMGMYWKGSEWGLYWYQAPIETQALLIEAFSEVTEDAAAVEEMKLWLLKQKQTQDWKTTKATVEACYALLLQGTDLLAESGLAEITVGGTKVDPRSMPDTKIEAGTGYFKTSWMGSAITPAMGKVEVTNPNKVAAWGALYWQYFEQLDKITFAETGLKIQKQLFLQTDTETGPKLSPIAAGQQLKRGDLVKVRIILVSDRAMEYVHMKDMRAAGFEPINVISRYKWQDGLGYYETTRDAATNFFFDYLPKGTFVFEYPLRATHSGDFSNGITTVQCMYAPEFTSHSPGIRVQVKE